MEDTTPDRECRDVDGMRVVDLIAHLASRSLNSKKA